MSLSELFAGSLTQPHTMRFQGEVRGRKVLILLDSGVNHNFISKDLVRELGLVMENIPAYSFKLGDVFRRGTSGCCKEVIVSVEKCSIKEKFYLFELGRVDIILGVTWLAALEDVKVNWRTLTMTF